MTEGYEPVSRLNSSSIPLYTSEKDWGGMRAAGRLAASTLTYIEPFVKPDISTEELDRLCHDFIVGHDAIPAPLGYKGYPKSICTSLNYVVCHGIPGSRKLREGDLLNIDVTVIYNGWHGDTSRMYTVGKPKPFSQRLINVTHEAMMRGIRVVKPGATTGDIGHAIQCYVEAEGFSVVRDFCGHGIGRVFHGEPEILHYGQKGQGIVLKEGMFFTIEPMVNAGKSDVKILPDGWTAVTRDQSLSAQWEHTIAVSQTGYEIFTLASSYS
jgi:methionyl aminopeptidase